MTFLTPNIALIAAAIAIPALVILYFLKLKRRDLEVSTTLLWKKAIQDLQANAPFQKLRKNILLLLQLLVLGLLLFALAQPQFADKGVTNQRHIILIDRSASMTATDGGRKVTGGDEGSSSDLTRLEAAKRKAIELIDGLREPTLLGTPGEEAMIIAFDTTAEVRQTFTASKADLRQAVNSIEPTSAPSSIERAYSLAQAYTGKEKFEEDRGFVPVGPGATIHLVTDGKLPDAQKVKTGQQDKVLYHAIGAADSFNAGITGVEVARAYDNPNKLSIFVELQSTARVPAKVDAQLSIDGDIIESREIDIAAATAPPPDAELSVEENAERAWSPGVGGFVFQIEREAGGVGAVRITPAGASAGADVLSADDTGYFVFPPARRLSVGVVTEGNMWLRYALESFRLSKLDVMRPGEYQALLDAGKTSVYDVVIFDRALPLVQTAVAEMGSATSATDGATDGASGGAAPAASPASPTAPAGATTAAGAVGNVATTAAMKKIRTVPPGRSLVLGAVPAGPTGANTRGTFDLAIVADVQKDHPVLALSGLEKLSLGKGPIVELIPESPVRAIASSDKGPALLEILDAQTHALVVTFDPYQTNWPLDAGWPLFLEDALYYLGGANTGSAGRVGGSEGRGSTGPLVQTGKTMEQRLPAGATEVRIALPNNQTLDLEPGPDGSVAYGPVNETGLYTISWKGQASPLDVTRDGRVLRAVAANLADPGESDTPAAPTLSLAKEIVVASEDEEVKLTRKLWPWLVLAAVAMVLFEWFIYNRKVAL